MQVYSQIIVVKQPVKFTWNMFVLIFVTIKEWTPTTSLLDGFEALCDLAAISKCWSFSDSFWLCGVNTYKRAINKTIVRFCFEFVKRMTVWFPNAKFRFKNYITTFIIKFGFSFLFQYNRILDK